MVEKVGGKLFEEEEGGTLEDVTGGVTSPFILEQAGASPDSAKMAGTPQRLKKKRPALEDTLATAERRKKPGEASPEALAQSDYLNRMSELGFIGDDIKALVLQDMAEAAQKTDVLEVSEEYLQTIPKDQREGFTTEMTALAEYIKGGSEAEIRKQAAKIENIFENPALTEAIERNIAESMADRIAEGTMDAGEVTLNTLMNANLLSEDELGLTPEELDDAFGVNWINMTPDQLSDAVDRVRARDFSEAQRLVNQLEDPTVPQAMKEDLRDRLAAMGATGELSQEARAATLVKQVEESGFVQFGGEVWDLDELLSDDGMNDVITGYLEGTEAEKKRFRKYNPQMAAYLDKNQEELTKAIETLGATEEELAEIRREVEGLRQIGDAQLSEGAMQAFFPEYEKGKFYAELPEMKGKLWEYLQANAGKQDTWTLVNNMNSLADIDPDLAKDLQAIAEKSPQKLNQVISQFVEADPEALQNVATSKAWEELSPESSAEDFVDFMFGEGASVADVESKLADLKAKAAFDPRIKEIYKTIKLVFDGDGDGKVDDSKDIHKQIARFAPAEISLEDALNGKKPRDRFRQVQSTLEAPTDVDGILYDTLSPVLTGPDDTVTGGEMDTVLSGDVSETAISDLLEAKDTLPLSAEAKQKLDQYAKERYQPRVDELVNAMAGEDISKEIFNVPTGYSRKHKVWNLGPRSDEFRSIRKSIDEFVAAAEAAIETENPVVGGILREMIEDAKSTAAMMDKRSKNIPTEKKRKKKNPLAPARRAARKVLRPLGR